MGLVFAACLLAVLGHVSGHGRLIEPPSRGSAWRFGFKTPANYQDNELYCGGFQNQWGRYHGKCGVCGDPYQGPGEHEAGGKYATGTIVRDYKAGESMKVTVELTANHKGWFEFRLCENNDPKVKVTFDCLDRHLLQIRGTKQTRFQVSPKMRMIDLDLELPKGITCSQCVVQWKYHAGNSWGVEPDTGRGCVGCGPQEEFYGCADISISGSNSGSNNPTTTTPKTTPKTSTKSTKLPSTKPSITTIIPSVKSTSQPVTTSTTSQTASTASPITDCPYRCCAIAMWKKVTTMNKWCHDNCSQGYCPPSHCVCR